MLQPHDRIGDYEVLDIVGQGNFGIVYRARDEQLHREVAIKVPLLDGLASEYQVDDFLNEARAAAQLNHPGIIEIHHVGRDDSGQCYVVMELAPKSLRDQMGRRRADPVRVARVMAAVADAVHHAHLHGLTHRDLKPGNILLDDKGAPRVADFGLALHESQQRQHAGRTSGTPKYMAPEQILGHADRLDGRADIWALGVILYEWLTGRRPFESDQFLELQTDITERDPKPPRQIDDAIPQALETIVLKCLRKSPADRYTTAADLAADLRRFIKSRRPASNRTAAPLLAVAAFALVAAAVAIGWNVWRPQHAAVAPQPQTVPVPVAAAAAVDSPERTPLECQIDLRIWDPNDTQRRGLRLDAPGAMPLRQGDQIRVEADANRPAYLYVLWVDSQGQVAPIYPWNPGDWRSRPTQPVPITELRLPEEVDRGWPMEGTPGTETLLLLAREEPLPADVDLASLLADIPAQPMQTSQTAVWFSLGDGVTQLARVDRAVNFNSQQIDDAVLRTHQRLRERLGPHFDLIRGVSFSFSDQR